MYKAHAQNTHSECKFVFGLVLLLSFFMHRLSSSSPRKSCERIHERSVQRQTALPLMNLAWIQVFLVVIADFMNQPLQLPRLLIFQPVVHTLHPRSSTEMNIPVCESRIAYSRSHFVLFEMLLCVTQWLWLIFFLKSWPILRFDLYLT